MHLRSDQYTHVTQDCPMGVEVHPADDLVEITLGEYRTGGDTLRLVVDNPETCLRLAATLHNARNKLVAHLHGKASLV
jgi:hypothetical protein